MALGYPKEKDYPDLPHSYVIFITENDYYNAELPLYHADRVVRELGESFEDGSHIIYVNGQYKNDNNAIGRLYAEACQDFGLTDLEEIIKKVWENPVIYPKAE